MPETKNTTVDHQIFMGLRKYTLWLGLLTAVAFGVISTVMLLPYFFDSSDSWPRRSGLGISVDALTGCQYLLSPKGGVTPRVDASGKHLCDKQAATP